MAGESAFEKIHVDESEKADLGGVLEQLNLPPTVVQFVRKNQRSIYVSLAVIITVVVVWALYDSYVEKRINESSSALTLAIKIEDEGKIEALQNVEKKFSGTDSARWAGIEIARFYIEKNEYKTAIEKFTQARSDLKISSPLYPLITYGLAQAEEAQKNYDAALQQYSILKTTKGYENVGYSGAARIYEVQGEKEKAIKELEQYIGVMQGETPNAAEKAFIDEKISRIKASM